MNNKIAIVYWSGTGNTEVMAKNVEKGALSAGWEVTMYKASNFSQNLVKEYEKIAFGCPSMGSEELEDGEFEPMFEAIKNNLKGKKIVLFGSHDWGDGEWMRTWQDSVISLGATLVKDGLIVNLTPDDNAIKNCEALGEALAKS